VNNVPKLTWTRAATVAANIHDLSQEERRAVEERSIATVNGKVKVLAVDVLAVVRCRQAAVVAA